MITQLLFTLFCTVFFCLGLYLVSRDGFILDFLQKPFIKAEYYKEVLTVKASTGKGFNKLKYVVSAVFFGLIEDIGPPIIMCITCMGSVWGFVVFVSLNGLHACLIPYLIINCFAAAFIQTFIWNLYAKYIL